jgi:hypothetical protein
MQEVIEGNLKPQQIGIRFDYKVLSDGVQLNPGVVYRLADDWDVDHSPFSTRDTEVDPPGPPAATELDYALLRLSASPGSEAVSGGKSADAKGELRGWVPLPNGPHAWTVGSPLLIFQHPDGQPLKLALDTEAVLETVPAGAPDPVRVRYATNTEPGSSGSPCFDVNWKLVALHHSGDPKYAKLKVSPRYNEGVPISAILHLLEQRGKLALLGEQDL